MLKKEFATVEEYEKYLSERLYRMDQGGRYNIYLHAVTTYTPFNNQKRKSEREELALKIDAIINQGFLLRGYSSYGAYGSMNGTSMFQGEINSKEKFDRVIGYKFDGNQNQEYRATLIMAIPKYIDIKDDILEFSSVEGEFPFAGANTKRSIFDLVKGDYLPKSLTLGIQIINNKTGEVVFLDNDKHLSSLSQAEQEKEMSQYVDQIKRYIEKYSVNGILDWQSVFKKETMLHEESISDFYYDLD